MIPALAKEPVLGALTIGAASTAAKAMDSDPIRAYMTNGLMFDPRLSWLISQGVNPLGRAAVVEGAKNELEPVFGRR
jgi:hypothetical protein